MTPSVLDPDRQLREREQLRDGIRSVRVVFKTEGGWSADIRPVGCEVKAEAAKKYKGESSKTRLEDVETEEDAQEYIEWLQRSYEEGETTRLP